MAQQLPQTSTRRYRGKAIKRLRSSAQHQFDRIVTTGAESFREAPDIMRILPFDPFARAPQSQAEILQKLRHALRAERRLGRMGHWRYNLRRHMALTQAIIVAEKDFCPVTISPQP